MTSARANPTRCRIHARPAPFGNASSRDPSSGPMSSIAPLRLGGAFGTNQPGGPRGPPHIHAERSAMAGVQRLKEPSLCSAGLGPPGAQSVRRSRTVPGWCGAISPCGAAALASAAPASPSSARDLLGRVREITSPRTTCVFTIGRDDATTRWTDVMRSVAGRAARRPGLRPSPARGLHLFRPDSVSCRGTSSR